MTDKEQKLRSILETLRTKYWEEVMLIIILVFTAITGIWIIFRFSPAYEPPKAVGSKGAVRVVAFDDPCPPCHDVTNSTAIGWRACAPFDNSIAIGYEARTTQANELVIRYPDGSEFRMILKMPVYLWGKTWEEHKF